MIHHKYGTRSLACLSSLSDRDLVEVAVLALQLSPFDISIICGRRTMEEQRALVANGDSQTLKSAHLDGLAIDVQPAGVDDPYPRRGDSREVVSEKLHRFEVIAAAFFEAADRLDYPLQWGNDWDCDGVPTGRDPDEKGWLQDLVHLQRAPAHRLAQAYKRGQERRDARARGEAVVS